jgi:hypothetical protein
MRQGSGGLVGEHDQYAATSQNIVWYSNTYHRNWVGLAKPYRQDQRDRQVQFKRGKQHMMSRRRVTSGKDEVIENTRAAMLGA